MHAHAPPCRLLSRPAFQLCLPSIHRTAGRDCLQSPYRLQTKALRVNKTGCLSQSRKSHAPIELGGCPVASIQRVAKSGLFSETSCGGSLRVTLFLYQRFGWPSRGYRVCVSVHNLPSAIFRSKDHRNPQINWGHILPSANPGLCPLYPHDIGKLRSQVLRYVLKASDLAISEM
jgi:hypothetical protein